MNMEDLSTGEVARRADVHVETVRYYERRGIVPSPRRSGSNRRRYPAETVTQVRFVKRAQNLGFSLAEVTELLGLRANRDASCDEVLNQARSKLREVDEKIRALSAMRRALKQLVEECPGDGPTSTCSILSALESEGDDE